MKSTKSKEISERITERVMFYFREVSNIPRGSGNEAAIADYLVKFAKDLKKKAEVKRIEKTIKTKHVHDVIISIPGTEGYENCETVVLQAHMDMVCQKSPESSHDFFKDPIDYDIADFIKAKGTTLGADDGIGVASILAILESDELAHPPLEALITSDEEEDMTGAMAITSNDIKGRKLINIDTESEGIFYYGCAGGVNANFDLPAEFVDAPENLCFHEIDISGLQGGHSGVQIHLKHANAHKLLGRILSHLTDFFNSKQTPFSVATLKGGDAKNVITLKASVVVGIDPQYQEDLENEVQNCLHIFQNEYAGVEKTMKITTKNLKTGPAIKVLSADTQRKLISALILIPNDVIAYHTEVDGLVETSCNLGVLTLHSDRIEMVSFIRSFFESKKQYVVSQMKILAEFIGASFSTDADFPNWEPNTKSELLSRFDSSYFAVFGKEPKFESIHAGLECGHFARTFPDMDMIACGPTITGAHTIEETLEVKTVGMIIEFLIDVLQKMNEKVEINENGCCGIHSGSVSSENPVHVCQCVR